MANHKIWFGTDEKMQWINCPSTNIQRNRVKWSDSGGYLNGGAFVKQSPYSHLKYNINWNLMDSVEAAKIMSYYDGMWGEGVVRFIDPFASKSNVLPLHWSVPRLCINNGAPTLGTTGSAVTGSTTKYNTIPNTPSTSAAFQMPAFSAVSKALVVPVPEGYNFYFGYSASVASVQVNNVTVNPHATAMTTNTYTNPGTVTLRIGRATAGPATINRMTGVIAKTPPTYTEFRQGEGNNGVRFDGPPSRTGYSSALDLESVSASFTEVGSWE